MPVFRVYRQTKKKSYQAVPVGFSIGAFFASFLWAAANNLWGKAFILFMGFLLMGGAAVAGALLNSPLLTFSALAGIVILPLWAGAQGQQWYCEKLESQGYQLVKRINTQSASHAINAAKRSEKNKEESAQGAKEPKQSGARFGRDFRDVRDKAAPNSNQPPPTGFKASPWKKR